MKTKQENNAFILYSVPVAGERLNHNKFQANRFLLSAWFVKFITFVTDSSRFY